MAAVDLGDLLNVQTDLVDDPVQIPGPLNGDRGGARPGHELPEPAVAHAGGDRRRQCGPVQLVLVHLVLDVGWGSRCLAPGNCDPWEPPPL